MFDEVYFSNVLTICGSGRNVGKTHLGCQIIKHFSLNNSIIAVKISKFNHQHDEDEGMKLISKYEGFKIWKQVDLTNKDSGRYLNAGALASYYIECDDTHLLDAFLVLYKIYGNSCLIICESASINKYISSAVSIFVQSATYPIPFNKLSFLNKSSLLVIERSIEISIPQLLIKSLCNHWLLYQPKKNTNSYV